jgi:signal peptidase II
MVVSTVTIVAISIALYLGHIDGLRYGVCLSAIISGGIGNMIDRIALGYVVDFIDFRLINFAVFNGADSFVCVGAGLLILALILEMKKEMRLEKEKLAKESEGKSE